MLFADYFIPKEKKKQCQVLLELVFEEAIRLLKSGHSISVVLSEATVPNKKWITSAFFLSL